MTRFIISENLFLFTLLLVLAANLCIGQEFRPGIYSRKASSLYINPDSSFAEIGRPNSNKHNKKLDLKWEVKGRTLNLIRGKELYKSLEIFDSCLVVKFVQTRSNLSRKKLKMNSMVNYDTLFKMGEFYQSGNIKYLIDRDVITHYYDQKNNIRKVVYPFGISSSFIIEEDSLKTIKSEKFIKSGERFGQWNHFKNNELVEIDIYYRDTLRYKLSENINPELDKIAELLKENGLFLDSNFNLVFTQNDIKNEYERLKSSFSIDELYSLLMHDSALVRAYGFKLLCELKDQNIFYYAIGRYDHYHINVTIDSIETRIYNRDYYKKVIPDELLSEWQRKILDEY